MKIRLLSDLHHEFFEDRLLYEPLGEDVLVIAGDLAVGPKGVVNSLSKFASKNKHVIYVTGNHEYYHNSITETDEYIKRHFEGTNVHFLNPGAVTIDGVTFIGATLWSEFGKDAVAKFACARSINDFSTIRGFHTDKCVELYQKHSMYIKEAYEVYPGKKVIITHFLPDTHCISEQYRGPDPINKYFANELGYWICDLQDVPYWLFGHTHDNVDVTIGNTRCIANPYGYNHNKAYKECLIDL